MPTGTCFWSYLSKTNKSTVCLSLYAKGDLCPCSALYCYHFATICIMLDCTFQAGVTMGWSLRRPCDVVLCSTVAHSKNDLGLNPLFGQVPFFVQFACSLYLNEFSSGTPPSSHSPKTCSLIRFSVIGDCKLPISINCYLYLNVSPMVIDYGIY